MNENNPMKQYEKSIAALNKFIAETPKDELVKMIDDAKKLAIEGPTLSEYFKMTDGIQGFQKLQDGIKKWSDGEFGKYRNGTPMAYHLKKEIDELIQAVVTCHEGVYASSTEIAIKQMAANKRRILMESVDCFTLLLDLLSHEQMDVYDLLKGSYEKLEINKKRKWGEPDENGVSEHIE